MDLPLQFDSAFFEKSRLSIMTVIYQEGTASYNRLKKILGFSDGALYSHLKKLADAGYLNGEKQIFMNAPQTVYSLTEKGRQEFSQYLRFLEKLVSNLTKKQGADSDEPEKTT